MHFLGQNYKKQSHIMMTLQGLETLSVVTAFMVVGVKFFWWQRGRVRTTGGSPLSLKERERGRKEGSLFNSATRNLATGVREICPLRIIRQRIRGVICRRRKGMKVKIKWKCTMLHNVPLQRSSSLTNPSDNNRPPSQGEIHSLVPRVQDWPLAATQKGGTVTNRSDLGRSVCHKRESQ